MLLKPKNYKSKKIQKLRKFKIFKKNNNLNFGQIGLISQKPLFLTSNKIFKMKLFLKRSIKKSDKTRRLFWFTTFPHLPLTKKPIGTRMGKGKGKLDIWYTNVRGGSLLIEFKNLRNGRALFFFNQINYKLNTKLAIVSKFKKFLNLPFKNKKIRFNNFW